MNNPNILNKVAGIGLATALGLTACGMKIRFLGREFKPGERAAAMKDIGEAGFPDSRIVSSEGVYKVDGKPSYIRVNLNVGSVEQPCLLYWVAGLAPGGDHGDKLVGVNNFEVHDASGSVKMFHDRGELAAIIGIQDPDDANLMCNSARDAFPGYVEPPSVYGN